MSQKEPIFDYLELVADMIPAAFYWCDIQNNTFLGVNSYCVNALNLKDKSEIVGKTYFDIYDDSEIANEMSARGREVAEGKKIIHSVDTVIRSGSKTPLYFSATRAPIIGDNGEIYAFLGISINITAERELETLKKERDLESLRSEAHRNKILQEFGVIAAKVAHDISSPLMVVNSSVSKLKTTREVTDSEIVLIEQSLNDIRNISGKILTTYREITGSGSKVKLHKVDDGNIKRYILLSSMLENQIGFKKIEWQNNPCKVELKISDKAHNLFAYISPTDFNRSISNLLNNAYESLGNENRQIQVEIDISTDNKKFILKIKDNGCGIPEDKLSHVLSGISSKHEGHGMGLSGAKTYFESISGKLELISEVNIGTEIILEFPLANDPSWLDRSINYNSDTKIAILDDSSTIIMLWQRVLYDLNLKCSYFITVDDFMKWYDKEENKENIILFADYDLGHENFTGLDVVSQVQDIRSYLVTNHSEEAWIQEIVKNNSLKLLPKKIIEHLEFVIN